MYKKKHKSGSPDKDIWQPCWWDIFKIVTNEFPIFKYVGVGKKSVL